MKSPALSPELRARQKYQHLCIALLTVGVLAAVALLLNGLTWLLLTRSVAKSEQASLKLVEYVQILGIVGDTRTTVRMAALGNDADASHSTAKLRDAQQKLSEHWAALSEILEGNEPCISRKQGIRAVVEESLERTSEILVLARHGNLEEAYQLWSEPETAHLVDTAREELLSEVKRLDEVLLETNLQTRTDLQTGLFSVLATGTLAFVVGIFAVMLLRSTLDATRRAEQLNIEKRQAEAAKQQREMFLATMSHEIRTPLNAIIGFSELLEKEELDPKSERYARSILAAGKTLLQLINDVLDLSKAEAGQGGLDPVPTDLRAMGKFIERLFREMSATKGIKLEIEIDPSLPNQLLLDEPRLRQILINLVGNAIKFTDEGSVSLKVLGKHQPDRSDLWELAFRIEDTGIGMNENDIEHIFDPFVQSGETSSRGTGLGLAIVKRFAQVLGGDVQARLRPGGGTTFELFLKEVPVSTKLAHASLEEDPSVDFGDLKRSVLLIADDNPVNRELLNTIFSEAGHSVHLASDGLEALRKAEHVHPDLVLMDLRMPGMDGATAAFKLKAREDFRVIPIIAVTASSSYENPADSMEKSPFDGYIRKPFTRAQLFALLSEFIPRVEHETAASELASEDQTASAPPALLEWLQSAEADEWPRIHRSQVHSEVEAFARSAADAAKKHGNAELEQYASRLISSVSTYSFREMKELLSEFPGVAERIRKEGAR